MPLADPAGAFTSMLHAIDARDWTAVRLAFADDVAIDYTELFGVPAAIATADAHVAGWEAFARHFDSTQHITGPVLVTANDGSAAHAATHVRAYHQMKAAPGGDIWIVAGHYEIELRRVDDAWKITALTLRVFYQAGNLAIPAIARARADG